MLGLTKRQRAAYDFIAASIEANGEPPTYREIGEAVGIGRNRNRDVANLLDALAHRGAIVRKPYTHRSIRLAAPCCANCGARLSAPVAPGEPS